MTEDVYDNDTLMSIAEASDGEVAMMKTEDDVEEERQEKKEKEEKAKEKRREERKQDNNGFPVVETLADAKAALSYHLVYRFSEHIIKDIGVELGDEEAFELLSLLLKTESFEIFNKSWKVISMIEMKLNKEKYDSFKEEAKYYYSIMTMLYEKDIYNL